MSSFEQFSNYVVVAEMACALPSTINYKAAISQHTIYPRCQYAKQVNTLNVSDTGSSSLGLSFQREDDELVTWQLSGLCNIESNSCLYYWKFRMFSEGLQFTNL